MSSIPSTYDGYRLPKQGSLDCLELRKGQKTPQPEPYQCLIEVHAASLNFRDLIAVLGKYPQPPKEDVIPCSDGAGEIVAIGEKVTKWKVGDRVIGSFHQDFLAGNDNQSPFGAEALGVAADGMLSQFVVLGEHGLARVPKHMSFEEAATLPCAGLTSWNGFFGLDGKSQLHPGQTAVLEGTGGVSVFGAQLALMAGCRAIITSSSDEKLKIVSDFIKNGQHGKYSGELVTVNYKTNPDWDKKVMEATNGLGADHVLEVGGPNTVEKAFASVKQGGTISSIGFIGGNAQPPNIGQLALFKSVVFRGLLVGSRVQLEEMCRAMEITGLRPYIGATFKFEDAKQAFQAMQEQKVVGKIVITVSEGGGKRSNL